MSMNFYNIADHSDKVTFRQALLKSIKNIPDLYMPEQVPLLPSSFYNRLHSLNFKEISLEVSLSMLRSDIPENQLVRIINEAFTFDIPLKKLDDNLFVLELFHGPTLSFKDIGARYMAGILEYLILDEGKDLIVLVATSGDTGSAVANAFSGKKGIKVVVLFPSGQVSEIQERQITTAGGNVVAVEVTGSFDDCQLLVKQAFTDKILNTGKCLTSANSINFGRLFPQSFYYFYAIAQLTPEKGRIAISVPSGNFGNLTAGLLARKMGLYVDRFIASTNINHSVPDYLLTGVFKPVPTRHTVSNAMDVGNPGNFPRILELSGKNHSFLTSVLSGSWHTDGETFAGMDELMRRYSYMSDPHGAVAYLGLKKYMTHSECTGIFLETAHPAKFHDIVKEATGAEAPVHESLKGLSDAVKQTVKIGNSFEELRNLLLEL